MPEYEAEVAEAIAGLADAVRTVAGVFASVAAAAHTNNPGDQRNMAMVIYEDAVTRFGDVHRKADPAALKQLEAWIDGLCQKKRT
jgi:hypothetical protein